MGEQVRLCEMNAIEAMLQGGHNSAATWAGGVAQLNVVFRACTLPRERMSTQTTTMDKFEDPRKRKRRNNGEASAQ